MLTLKAVFRNAMLQINSGSPKFGQAFGLQPSAFRLLTINQFFTNINLIDHNSGKNW